MINVTRDQLSYLRSLVRGDIRKKQRDLERAHRRGSQTDAEFGAFLAQLRRSVIHKQDILAVLDGAYYLDTRAEMDAARTSLDDRDDEFAKAAKACAKRIAAEAAGLGEDEYADLVDELTVEHATDAGVSILSADVDVELERFALAVDEQLRRIGAAHPYESQEA